MRDTVYETVSAADPTQIATFTLIDTSADGKGIQEITINEDMGVTGRNMTIRKETSWRPWLTLQKVKSHPR